MKLNRETTKYALTSVFAAVLAVCSWVAVPLPSGVSLTLQTFAVAFCGYFLGNLGVVSVGIYILLGCLGIPVFSAFSSGLGWLFGASGGFIWGFLILALFCAFGNKTKNTRTAQYIGILGLIPLHAVGVLQFCLVTESKVFPSIAAVSLPYIIKDLLSVFAAYKVSQKIKSRVNIS